MQNQFAWNPEILRDGQIEWLKFDMVMYLAWTNKSKEPVISYWCKYPERPKPEGTVTIGRFICRV
jgi:hypothetical protein